MLKLLKGLDRPPTIINTERIKFVQCEEVGKFIRVFMNEGFHGNYFSFELGVVLEVDYNCGKYNSEVEVMQAFLSFLNGSETDEFGICPIKL